MTRLLLATLQDARIPRPPARSVVLGLLIVATLVMPVSYRAGSDTAHAHTVFQGLIDAIVGHPHHHDDAAAGPAAPASALFAPLPTSLLIATGHVDRFAAPSEPDIPQIFGLSVPISAFAAIQELRVLILALLASIVVGRLWSERTGLIAVPPAVETPPPRRTA